jgi:mannose-6-phosphate isomerase-like protein (cupin superfamily)
MSFGCGGIQLNPGQGRSLSVLGLPFTLKAADSDTGGAYFLVEGTLVDDGPPPHIHKNEDEAFYVLEGEFNVQIGIKKSKQARGHSFLFRKGRCTPNPMQVQHLQSCFSSFLQPIFRSFLRMQATKRMSITFWRLLRNTG